MHNTVKSEKGSEGRIGIIISLAIILMVMLEVFVFGFAKFGYHTVRCKTIPIAVNLSTFKGGSTYLLPGNYLPGLWSAKTSYVCTEAEAIERGAKKDLYNNQPVLNSDTFTLILVGGVTTLALSWWIVRAISKKRVRSDR